MNSKHDVSRRGFLGMSLAGAAVASFGVNQVAQAGPGAALRLGGPVFEKTGDPDTWVRAVKKLGYSAAYCPVGADADSDTVAAYERAAKKADIIIAEVGAWSNPISPDETLDRKTDSVRLTQACLTIFDPVIRSHPDQYFWYNKRWMLEPLPSAKVSEDGARDRVARQSEVD